MNYVSRLEISPKFSMRGLRPLFELEVSIFIEAIYLIKQDYTLIPVASTALLQYRGYS